MRFAPSGLQVPSPLVHHFLADAPLVPEDTDTNVDVYVTPPMAGSGPLILASFTPPTNATQIVSNPTLTPDGGWSAG